MVFLDKLGWPVELIKNKRFINFIRLLIHTRKIKRKWDGYKIPVETESNCHCPEKCTESSDICTKN